MKVRFMGVNDELEMVSNFFEAIKQDPRIRKLTVSAPYPNRGNSNESRVYVDIELKDVKTFDLVKR